MGGSSSLRSILPSGLLRSAAGSGCRGYFLEGCPLGCRGRCYRNHIPPDLVVRSFRSALIPSRGEDLQVEHPVWRRQDPAGRVPIFPVRLLAAPGVKWPYVSTGSTALPCHTSARALGPRPWRDPRIGSALSSAG